MYKANSVETGVDVRIMLQGVWLDAEKLLHGEYNY